MDVNVDELEGMSQEELEALEDKVVASDVEEPIKEDVKEEEPVVEEVAEVVEQPKEEVVEEDQEDLQKHISPPKKWIQKRLSSKSQPEQPKPDDISKVTKELADLKSKLDWLEQTGVDTKKTPMDMLSPEKIADVRKEFGDELADMFQGVKALQQRLESQEPEQPTEQPDEPQVEEANIEMENAIDGNLELSYWRESNETLWGMAVDKNEELLKTDPSYRDLSFNDRFAKVVDTIKAEVVKEAKENANPIKNEQEVPGSLSGHGNAPTKTNETILERLDNATPEEAEKIYRGLSEEERDKVDIELGI